MCVARGFVSYVGRCTRCGSDIAYDISVLEVFCSKILGKQDYLLGAKQKYYHIIILYCLQR